MIGGKKFMLAPGLSATAEIKTGNRRIIDYLLSPLSRRVQEAGRER
jgi:hemolysin D